jgi:hypothetical protein
VLVGGELTADMLDLTYDRTSGVYLAPMQMKANNGVMIVDDFGRQVLTPEQLLNRWIVPLDRRIDFLSLAYGVSFEIPFDVKVVLSTNLDPSDLGDEAFFRRIQSKIYIGPVSEESFDWILARVAHSMGIGCDTEAADYLKQICLERGGDLRPHLPTAVCKLLKAVAEYEGVPPVLDETSIDRVIGMYYTSGASLPGARGRSTSSSHRAPSGADLGADVDPVGVVSTF